MKKSLLFTLMICAMISHSQKKKNGTIYIEHPAINVVESMVKAYVEGDSAKVSMYLADDLKTYNGTNDNKDAKGRTKKNFLGGVNWWKNNVDYVSVERSPGAYPDALHYKKDNNKDETWVQTWEHIKGVHNKTGVKIDYPMHRLFVVNKNNKIKTIINYGNGDAWSNVRESYTDRKNGTLYNHHEYINIVRRMIHALEFKDIDKGFSFFDEKARFMTLDTPRGEFRNLEEEKTNFKEFLEGFDIRSIDVSGYPDYLHYELGNSGVVQSWWTLRLTRKSDKKKIDVPIFFIHDFNDDGKIVREIAYYSEKLLEN